MSEAAPLSADVPSTRGGSAKEGGAVDGAHDQSQRGSGVFRKPHGNAAVRVAAAFLSLVLRLSIGDLVPGYLATKVPNIPSL